MNDAITVRALAPSLQGLRWSNRLARLDPGLFTRLDHPLRALLAELTGHDIPGAGLVTVLVLITSSRL